MMLYMLYKRQFNNLNPGQMTIATVCIDETSPIQWTWPVDFGENKFVIMQDLHSERARWKILAD